MVNLNDMGNLKLKKTKVNNADVARIASVIKNVNDLIAMKLIRFAEDNSPRVFFYPELFTGKGSNYMVNFAKNLLVYWKIHSGKQPEETNGVSFFIADIESEKDLFQYFGDGSGLGKLS